MKAVSSMLVLAGLARGVLMAAPTAGQTATPQGAVAVVEVGADSTGWSDATLGFVASTGFVIARVDGSATVLSVLAATDTGDASYEARLVAYDPPSGLGLLTVSGLAAPPYLFSLAPARAGQDAHGVAWELGADDGTVASARNFSMTAGTIEAVDTLAVDGRRAIAHTAFEAGKRNVGGPLLNMCGEVVGVVVAATQPADPQATSGVADGRRRRGGMRPPQPADAHTASGVAVPPEPLLSLFAIYGLSVQVAAEPCLSAEERRIAEQQARLEQEAARADSLEATARTEGARRAELERLSDSVAQANEAARSEAEALRERNDSLQQEARSTEQALRRRIYVGVAAAAVLLALVGILGHRAAKRAKRRAAEAEEHAARAEREAVDAEREAVDAEQAARAARSDLASRETRDRQAAEVPGILLEGTGDRPLAVRIPGRVIGRDGGGIVGRSPFAGAIVLDHPEVSRRHFRLSTQGASILIEDLGSTNGTTLDGARLQPGVATPLRNGARLGIGGVSVTVTMQPSRASTGHETRRK